MPHRALLSAIHVLRGHLHSQLANNQQGFYVVARNRAGNRKREGKGRESKTMPGRERSAVELVEGSDTPMVACYLVAKATQAPG